MFVVVVVVVCVLGTESYISMGTYICSVPSLWLVGTKPKSPQSKMHKITCLVYPVKPTYQWTSHPRVCLMGTLAFLYSVYGYKMSPQGFGPHKDKNLRMGECLCLCLFFSMFVQKKRKNQTSKQTKNNTKHTNSDTIRFDLESILIKKRDLSVRLCVSPWVDRSPWNFR